MDSGASAHTGSDAPASAGAEARGAERFTLLVRAAKLIADGREYLCVLRDASATGVKVRMFHKAPAAASLELEVGSGERVPVQLMWSSDGHAGLRFEHEVDVHQLIDDSRGEFPKRQIRLNVDRPVLLQSGSLTHVAVLRNISQSGACIECDQRLMLRQAVRVEADGLAPIYAKVCWRRHPLHGLVFERGFTLEELARDLVTLQHGEAVPPDFQARVAGSRADG